MSKRLTTKDCIKFVCDGLDTINDNIKKQRLEFAEQNRINKERLEFEKKTKDRVDISLKDYEQLKRDLEHYKAIAEHYEGFFNRFKVGKYIEKAEPSTIKVSTMSDPIRLSTRVNIQFESKKYDDF